MEDRASFLPAICGVWYHNSFTDSDWTVSEGGTAALSGRE